MKNYLFIKRLERLNFLSSKWARAHISKRVHENLGYEIVEQYLATKRAKLEDHLIWPEQHIRKYNIKEFDATFDWVTLDPIVELAKEGKKHLENNQLDKVREIFDALENDKALISKIKSRISNEKVVREHPIDVLIANELQKNPNITLPKLTKTLKTLEGKGVIDEWDEEENEIYSRFPDNTEARKVRISGLKERFYRVRNKK